MSAGRTVLVTAGITTALLASIYYAMGRSAPIDTETSRPAPARTAVQETPAAPFAAPVAEASPAPASTPAAETAAPDTTLVAPAARSLEDVVSRAMPAVVRVEAGNAFGSGFFVRADTILTNVHVVGGNTSVTVRMPDGRTGPARVESTAPEFDIAVLRMVTPAASQPILAMGSAARARPGQEVVVLGTPMGLQNTVTRGIVSALREVGRVTLVQTDAAINPGNSGGPVLDREGNVLGIATMGLKHEIAQGLSFAVAIDHAQPLLEGRRPDAAAPTPLASLTQALGAPPAPPAAAAPSESESRREAGSRAYETAIAQLARKADDLDRYWGQFKRVCYNGTIDGGFDRDWFAIFDARAMRGAVAPGCAAQFAEVRRVAEEVRDGVIAAEEAARRADVYPGTRRETLRKNRLDYPAWSR